MANLLDRFKKASVGSVNRDRNYSDEILSSGDFQLYEGINAIVESWKNILITGLRTADHDPEYGSRLREYVFDPADSTTRDKIVDEIKTRLMKFDNRATISKIDIHFLNDRKGFVVDCLVSYNDETKNLKVNIDEYLLT